VVLAQAVAHCRQRGLVDDAAAGRLWAAHWSRQGYAWPAIRLKLAAKGLEARAIAQAAPRAGGLAEEAARARALVAPYLSRSGLPESQQARLPAPRQRASSRARQAGRAARRLAAHGFDAELIERVLEESFGNTDSTD
jgi:SOS response regulatory protein OraA/RecX